MCVVTTLIGVYEVILTGLKNRKCEIKSGITNSRSGFRLAFPDAGHVLTRLSSRGLVNFLKATKRHLSTEFVGSFLG